MYPFDKERWGKMKELGSSGSVPGGRGTSVVGARSEGTRRRKSLCSDDSYLW